MEPTETPLIFTALCLLFAADGVGPRAILWAHRAIAVLSLTLTAITLSIVTVLHDDWCCYPDRDPDVLVYGRCDKRAAAIRHMVGFTVACGAHSWSKAAIVILALTGVAASLLIVAAVIRIILIKSRLHTLLLPPTSDAIAAAHRHASKKRRGRPKAPAIFFLKRFLLIAWFDPLSVTFAYASIVMRLTPGHVVVQVILTGGAAACAAVRLTLSNITIWKHYLLLGTGLFCGGLALLHHIYLNARLTLFIHTCEKRILRALKPTHTHASDEAHAKVVYNTMSHAVQSIQP